MHIHSQRLSLCHAALALALALSGCGDEDSDGASSDKPKLGPTTGALSNCEIDVSAGDHKFSCDGLTFYVMVAEACLDKPCGLIVDVHGGTMSGLQMRDNTQLHELAPAQGFITVHASQTGQNTGGSWSASHYPTVANFVEDLLSAYAVDRDRVHFTGFSQGGLMTWWFLCNRTSLFASAAPVAAAFTDQKCFDGNWQPRVPILYMNGLTDTASTISESRALIETLTTDLALTGGNTIEDDGHVVRKSWTGSDGMQLDYIEHDYGGQAVLGGHCIPGGIDISGAPNNFGLNATTCTTGDIKMHWGKTVLQWFIDHPRQR